MGRRPAGRRHARERSVPAVSRVLSSRCRGPHPSSGGLGGQPLHELPHAQDQLRAAQAVSEPRDRQPVAREQCSHRKAHRLQPLSPRPVVDLHRRCPREVVWPAPTRGRGRRRVLHLRRRHPSATRRCGYASDDRLSHGLGARARGLGTRLGGADPRPTSGRSLRGGPLHRCPLSASPPRICRFPLRLPRLGGGFAIRPCGGARTLACEDAPRSQDEGGGDPDLL